MSYGHSTTFRVNKNGDAVDTIAWNQSNNRWEGTTYYLYRQGLSATLARWAIRLISNTNAVAYGDATFHPDNTSENNPADETYDSLTDTWTISEISGGAQGDPHIKPLFGKNYTI